MPIVWSLGSIIGPSFGGLFAEPAEQYPQIFGHIEFFKRFPFALPNLILMVFFLFSATIAALFLHVSLLKESLHIITNKPRKHSLASEDTGIGVSW